MGRNITYCFIVIVAACMVGCRKPADYSYKEPEFPVTEEVAITPVTTGEAISAQSFFCCI